MSTGAWRMRTLDRCALTASRSDAERPAIQSQFVHRRVEAPAPGRGGRCSLIRPANDQHLEPARIESASAQLKADRLLDDHADGLAVVVAAGLEAPAPERGDGGVIERVLRFDDVQAVALDGAGSRMMSGITSRSLCVRSKEVAASRPKTSACSAAETSAEADAAWPPVPAARAGDHPVVVESCIFRRRPESRRGWRTADPA